MAHSDVAITHVLEEFGAEAYGIWWLILEDIAAPMEPGKMIPSASHSLLKWSQICYCSTRRFRSIALRLAEKRLMVIETNLDRITIAIPNILKYKDEYSKKSGETTEQDQKQIQIESRAESIAHLEPHSDELKEWFDSVFWPLYPRKVAKPDALKAARKMAASEDRRAEIICGLERLLPEYSSRELTYVKYPGAWLRNEMWNDPVIAPINGTHKTGRSPAWEEAMK